MTLLPKINTTAVRFEAHLPWAPVAPKPLLGEMLHAAPRLKLEPFNQGASSFKMASHALPTQAAAAPRSVLKTSAPVNDPWRKTALGNGEFISMAGPNGTDVPQWQNAFISKPVGFVDYARGYVSEMVGGTIDLAQTVLSHVHDTALDMARRGEIWPTFPTAQKLIYDAGAIVAEAFAKPLGSAVADAIEHPDLTLNHAGDAIAEFVSSYKNSVLDAHHTAASSAALGASTYLALSMGGKEFMAKLFSAQRVRTQLKGLERSDHYNQRRNIIEATGSLTPATVAHVWNGMKIDRPNGDNRYFLTYSPHLALKSGEKYKPQYLNGSSDFNHHGFSATYSPGEKILFADINSSAELNLGAALGDSLLMTSALIRALEIEGATVRTISLRLNELQGAATSANTYRLIDREVNQHSAIQLLQKKGFVVHDLDLASGDGIRVILRKT